MGATTRSGFTLNSVGGHGETQPREGTSVPPALKRAASPVKEKTVESAPKQPKVSGDPTFPNISSTHALLLAMLLGAAIFVSLYYTKGKGDFFSWTPP